MPTRLNGLKVAMLMLDAGKGQLQGMVKVSSALRKNGATDVVGNGCADASFSSMRQKHTACSASLVIIATMVRTCSILPSHAKVVAASWGVPMMMVVNTRAKLMTRWSVVEPNSFCLRMNALPCSRCLIHVTLIACSSSC